MLKCALKTCGLLKEVKVINFNTCALQRLCESTETKVSSAQKVLWTIMLTKFMEFKQKKKTFIKGSFSCIHASSDILKEGSGLLMSSM
jgi:hypothetical protein